MSSNGEPAGEGSAEPNDRRGIFRRLTGAVTGRVVEAIDPDQVVDHIDVDAVVERIDVNGLLDRVDVNRLLDRVDVDRLLERVDVDALLDRIDMDELVRRSGIPEIVADSTGHLAGSAIDLARRQLAGLDVVIHRAITRAMRRDPGSQPVAPPLLMPGPPT